MKWGQACRFRKMHCCPVKRPWVTVKPIHRKERIRIERWREGSRAGDCYGQCSSARSVFQFSMIGTNSLLLLKGGVRIKLQHFQRKEFWLTQYPFFPFPLSHYVFFLLSWRQPLHSLNIDLFCPLFAVNNLFYHFSFPLLTLFLRVEKAGILWGLSQQVWIIRYCSFSWKRWKPNTI